MPSQPEIIDTHCHLDDKAFDEDRAAVWERAQAAGVAAIINPASNIDDSRATVKLAHEMPGVFAAVGIHPHAAVEMNAQKLEEAEKELSKLSKDQTVVAIGEFGFDSKNGSAEVQKPAVQMLLKLAHAQELPIILHCRDMYTDLFAAIDQSSTAHSKDGLQGPKHTGVVHSFTGGPAELDQILKRGLHVAFGGIVTFDKKTELLREAAKQCPLDRMLLETDSPSLTPVPRRGRRNEPAEVATICDFIAKLRGISYAELARATTQNARRLFSLPEGLGARKTQ